MKSGLPEAHNLELFGDDKTSVGLMMWVTWMMMMLVQKRMDTVFCILCDNDKQEINMLGNWGKCTKDMVEKWIWRLKDSLGDKFDKDNLTLSGCAVKNSMGPTLSGWTVSLTGPDTTGPELFLAAVHQVSFMMAALVRSA